ncbi:Protein of unknown function [Pyronema omphalodes CBS 100304]|uniref:Uncharacterized protein n=1 Tax=Pyronema omphalodes (strain CBS 100304) TaxID=1076935 RepID=U4LJY0_PYROM|nr:Protein of unknown function [Pyronema omphalodes CBS 100304]
MPRFRIFGYIRPARTKQARACRDSYVVRGAQLFYFRL